VVLGSAAVGAFVLTEVEWAFDGAGGDVAVRGFGADREERRTGVEALGRAVHDLPVAEVAAAARG
jgi:hypothetical protein